MDLHLKSIHIYPIKGLRPVSLEEAHVEPRGLANDRRWMLTDSTGTFISQRQLPQLTWLSASITPEGLLVHAPGAPDLAVTFPGASAPRRTVSIWRDTVEAAGVTEKADQWFSTVLGQPCHLVYMDGAAVRTIDTDLSIDDTVVSFADGYPLLLTSEQSLADLNSRLEQPITMQRFGPNVVVAGADPFVEDHWREIQMGSVCFHVAKSCARCQVTTIDPVSATAGKEPLRTLSTFRKRGSKVYFGENLIPRDQGTIRVGDPVTVTAFRTQN